MTVELRIVDDPAATCAEMLSAVAARGGHIVLAGGSTPRAAYRMAAAAGGSWSGATAWFGDERCVPPDDERSNYLMVKGALLDPLGDGAPVVKRMRGELGPDEGAADYERELEAAGSPRFDFVLLGLGPDVHTASLFPDQATLNERSRLVIGVDEAGHEPLVARITMTLPALAAGREIVFLITGADKAPAVAAAFGPGAAPDPHAPASLLPPLAESVIVLLDAAAAGELGSG